MSEPALLARARSHLREEVAPRAAELDRDPIALGRALDRLAELGLLGVRVPTALGGVGFDLEGMFAFQEELARASGALAFLATQHLGATALLARLGLPAVQRELLPDLCGGRRRLGIGFSHLRRAGRPLLVATPLADGGWRLDGRVAWVTGQGFFEGFVLAGTLEDGAAVFGLAPLADEPGLSVGAPMELAAMASTRTVEVRLEGWTLPPGRVAFQVPAGWIEENDRVTVAARSAFPLGCARAGLDALSDTPGAGAALERLEAEHARCRAAVLALPSSAPLEEREQLRAWATELSVRCAYAAVTAAGGRALDLSHPSQRVYREALAFTVLGQTAGVQRATLDRLTAR